MPWGARDTVSLREEFVLLAMKQEFNFSELCRQFSISRKTGYKWLERAALPAQNALQDLSRRPRYSPHQTPAEMEARVVELRIKRPQWGGRKLKRVLEDAGVRGVPATSTITDILRRHGLIVEAESQKRGPFQRFERAAPNELWQMDFKGDVAMDIGRCHPLTIVDDHSRYAVGLFACANERSSTVREHLITAFRRYGLPQNILCDNGPPWGTAGAAERHTELTVWMMQAGVRVLHGRPYHPQTQGKDERFHRTLKAEVLFQRIIDLARGQARFDSWRQDYNWVRPHQALNLDVPGKRYAPSNRPYREQPLEPEYGGSGVETRKVDAYGSLKLWGRKWRIGKAFVGQTVAVEPTQTDGAYNVYFCGQLIKTLDRQSVQ